MQDSEQSTHMDRLTQTQNSIDELIQIMYSTLSYLTRKANFKQLHPEIPITQIIPNSDSPELFEANQRELVGDFLKKAKQLEYLISVLPCPSKVSGNGTSMGEGVGGEDEEFEELEREMGVVNEEYLEALKEAKELHEQLSISLRTTLDARSNPP